MSNISNRHNVLPFVSGISAALSGQRLAKVGYKQTKVMADRGEKAPASICVSIPPLAAEQIMDNIQALLPHISNFLEGVQDSVIRSIYEGRKYALDSVSDEEISVQACISYLSATTESSRWSKEYIEAWFDKVLGDNLTVVIAEKLGFELETQEQVDVVQKHLNGYKGLFSSLAGKSASINPAQISGLRRALDVCSLDSESDMITGRVIARLDEMEKIQNGLIDMIL